MLATQLKKMYWEQTKTPVDPSLKQIEYTSTSQVTLYDSTNVVSHTFSDGTGIITLSSKVVTVYPWLRGTAVTGVSLPSCVTTIGNNAFFQCTSLVSINLPDGLTTIGQSAFKQCSNVEISSLPSGITSIGSDCFYGCAKFTATSLPSGLTQLSSNTFYSTGIAITTMPSGITKFYTGCFGGCLSLTSLTFLGQPTSIANSTFTNCTNLRDIYVPWASGAVSNAPWGARWATIHYNYTPA